MSKRRAEAKAQAERSRNFIKVVTLFMIANANSLSSNRRWWVHDINESRNIESEYHTLLPRLKNDQAKFLNYFRMNEEKFYGLLARIESCIKHQNTNYRDSICPEERLVITLRYGFKLFI